MHRPAEPARLSTTPPPLPPPRRDRLIGLSLLKLLGAVILFLFITTSPDYTPNLHTALGQLIAGALLVDGLLSPLLGQRSGPTVATLRLLLSGTKYLLLLLLVLLLAQQQLRAPLTVERFMDVVIVLLLLVLPLLRLMEHWRRWQWGARKISAPAAARPAPAVPGAISPHPAAVAQGYQSSLSFLLWLLLLLPLALAALGYLLFCLWGLGVFGVLVGGKPWALLKFGEFQFATAVMVFLALVITMAALDGFRRRIWRQWRFGYDANSARFFRDRGTVLGGLRREADWPAADFIGLYWEKYDRDGARLWLAGPAGGEDELLVELNHWRLSNEALAKRLVAALSTASGRPVLYRWPTA